MRADSVRRAVVTGVGFVSSIGNDRATVTDSVRRLRHGFEEYTFDTEVSSDVKVFGTIKDFSFPAPNYLTWTYPKRYKIPREVRRALSPHGLYSMCALYQAIDEAGLSVQSAGLGRTGLHCASAGSPYLMHHYLSDMEAKQSGRGTPMGVVSSISGTLNFTIGAYLKIEGANCGFISACASSAHAIGYALDEIALGRLDRVIIVAGEDFTLESIIPFSGMRALTLNPDPDTASRPFDQKRDGFVGSGGGVALILEAEDFAKERNARPLARFLGWGQSADGYSPMISHPEGSGLSRAMRNALESTGLKPQEIEYINAHATSTQAGDASELKAIREVFSPEKCSPKVSSAKSITGHTLSMAGALEAAICAIALDEQFIPGTAHLNDPDPLCEGLDLPRKTEDLSFSRLMTNSSGFGGSNVSLVMERA